MPPATAELPDSPEQSAAAEPDAAAGVSAPPDGSSDHAESADASPAPGSFLSRLIAKLRQPAAAPAAAGEETLAADDASVAAPPARRRFAALVRPTVWIAAASVALFAVVGTLATLLWQAHHEQAVLEAKLKEIEQELKVAAPAAAPSVRPAPPLPAEAPVETAPDPRPKPGPRAALAGGDCQLRDAESVSLRLKDCIDAFNEADTRSRPPRQHAPNR